MAQQTRIWQTLASKVHYSTFYNNQDIELTKLFHRQTNGYRRTANVHNAIWFTRVKECHHANFQNLSETRVSTTKWTKQESERQKLYDITYRCNLHMHSQEARSETHRWGASRAWRGKRREWIAARPHFFLLGGSQTTSGAPASPVSKELMLLNSGAEEDSSKSLKSKEI